MPNILLSRSSSDREEKRPRGPGGWDRSSAPTTPEAGIGPPPRRPGGWDRSSQGWADSDGRAWSGKGGRGRQMSRELTGLAHSLITWALLHQEKWLELMCFAQLARNILMPWASWGRPVALGLENKDTARKPRCGPVRVGSVPSPLRPGAPSVLRACPWGVFGAGPADSAHASGPRPNSESRALPTAGLLAHLSEGLAPCPHPNPDDLSLPRFP